MKKKLSLILLFVLSVLLISEWIYPFAELTELSTASWIILFITLSLASFFTHLRYYWTIPLHIVMIYVVAGIYYAKDGIFSGLWFSSFFQITFSGFSDMVQFHSSDISMDFILIVFLIALWLLSYITTYSILRKQRIMSVLILTVSYLAVINTFTDYNSSWAIVRTVLEGFLLLHLALTSRIATPNRLNGNSLKRNGIIYHAFILFLLAVFVCSSLMLPKKAPIWPDPVPVIRDALGINTTRTVGYSEDDTELGGAVKKDNATVFKARTDNGHYWRVESKRIYTGVGWANEKSTELQQFSSGDNFPIQLSEETTGEAKTAEISFEASSEYAPYPYGTQAINSAVDTFNANLTTEKITPTDTIKNYTIELKTPVYNIETMQKADFSTLPDSFVSKYTQTPSKLPKRVATLANKITKDADSIYDKTKAIESYLSASGEFTYSTDDAKETPNGADYVDQFLFETKIGYCDNFSTSMVIMLRTLGIPTRWAKGYTPGEGEKDAKGDKATYTITNNNAHSWPEVFFPGTGWVPFEPTATFSNPENFQEPTTETANKPDTPNESSSEASKPDTTEKTPEQTDGSSSTGETKQAEQAKTDKVNNTLKIPSWIWWIPVGLIVAIAAAAFIFRRRIRSYLLLRTLKKNPIFSKTYLKLLKSLASYGYIRQSSETLRQFAVRVDTELGTNNFSKLTKIHESNIYSQTSGDRNVTTAEIKLFIQIITLLTK
ncbi:transglutaminase-like domain-containing protein [Listeria seeligeri]|uniref:transglutaminase-like domain-containing protein n=1 Tax=Listeria seeligeri TaxID=1640 RepID=UPI001627042D|nr:transglutaminase-like domain-containing protein [Listeria seeligeri]MBC1532634.1 transglutaminase domain-containing protein [Listeria seeligeri]MBC1739853.1 transglutaminase domain-containing protein [Listeria seeligeri]MBC1745280.1 transglutaminase domain-containing protein [Listeria seeligeri]MBC1748308.1 transglutaminase domain-containing protein [Listeria seeligeri]MBC1820829.1 transglutaminase domain-containing protein [Listeria seeligeri]